MRKAGSLYFLYIVFICLLPYKGNAQSLLIDSLSNALNLPDLTTEDRVMTMGQLARALFYKDIHEAIRIEKQALLLSHPLKNNDPKIFTFGTLTYLYIQANDLAAAKQSIDSAIWYAEHTDNRVAKGYAWYRKGWLEYVNEDGDKSMHSLLQALKFLEGQQAWSYESGIYYYIAGVYWGMNDVAQYSKYAKLSIQAARLGNNPDDLCRGYQAIGSSFLHAYRKDTTQRQLLDSVLHYNNTALRIAAEQQGRMIFRNTPAVVALNNADIYFEYYPPQYKDSAEKYINISLTLAREIHYPEVIANCYGILSEYHIRDGQYDAAEKILLMALTELETDSTSTSLTKARMLKALSTTAEKSGNQSKALHYYKEYSRYNEAYFDTEKMSISKKLEAQYQSEKKEQELATLQQYAAFNRKLNFFYICLIIAGLITLIFVFRAYYFRLKAARQQQQLLAVEKEEAHLQSQLQAAEAARLQAEQLLLQERQDRLQKELLAGTLQVEEKNELLQSLQKKLAEHAGNYPALRQMDRIITESRKQDEDLESVKADFAEIHPEFFIRLQEKAQHSLTRLDLKYCSYIFMGLPTKDIANRLNVAPKSIRMARYRLKQKLGLQKEDNLDLFICTLT